MPTDNVLISSGSASLATSPFAAKALQSIMAAVVRESVANRLSISSRLLEISDLISALDDLHRDNEREAWGSNFILMDAAAMLACAPYRCTLLLTENPFESASALAEALQMDLDELRLRLHRCLMNAGKVFVLGYETQAAIMPALGQVPRARRFPATPLRTTTSGSDVLLIIHPGNEALGESVQLALAEAYPESRIVMFDSTTVAQRAWYAVIHIGAATSLEPGAGLADAWAGAVPVLQLSGVVPVTRPRAGEKAVDLLVNHGTTGFLCTTIGGLVSAFGDLLADPVIATVVARSAQRTHDAGKEWLAIAEEVLQ